MTPVVRILLLGLLLLHVPFFALDYLADPLAPVACGRTSDCVGERSFR